MYFSLLQKQNSNDRLVRSHWMLEAQTSTPTEKPLTDEKRLAGNVDIAIIGGGFVGLWTAIFAKQAKPKIRIVVLERDMCGGGASGRNGGLVMSWWPEITTLVELFGDSEALKLANDSEKAISALGRFCQKHHIEAHFRQSGWLWTATNKAQLGAWDKTFACSQALGASPYQYVSPKDIARRSGSAKHLAGIFEASNATIQPALLIAGLKRVALAMGIEIYENTPVLELSKSQPAVLTTPNTDLIAKKVVLATNAWSTAIPELKRYVLPVSSSMIVTDRISDDIKKIGLTGGECITNSRTMMGYYHVTHDNRIAFGKGVANLTYHAKITDIFSQSKIAAKLTEKDFRNHYPMLNNVGVKAAWTGPVDYTRDILPIFGRLDGAPHICYGVGWSGNGISPSQIGAEILSALALDIDNKWANYPLVGRTQRGLASAFPPEPIRYVGGQAVRWATLYKEQMESQNRRPPWLLRHLAALGQGIGS